MFGIDDALIGFGGSLLSGILGGSSKRKQQKREEQALREANATASKNAADLNKEIRSRADKAAKVPIVTKTSVRNQPTRVVQVQKANLSTMVADAVKSGFNPLTVLRAGGLGSYGTSTSTTTGGGSDTTSSVTGSTAMDAALAGQHLPALSPVIAQTQAPGMGEIVGNAIGAGTNTLLQTRAQEKQNQFQMALMGAQLSGSQMPGAYSGSRFGATPVATLQGSYTSGGGSGVLGPVGPGGSFSVNPSGAKKGYQKPGDPMCWSGYCFNTDPGTSDAQSWESWLGEAADWLAAPIVLGGNLQAVANRHGAGSLGARLAIGALLPSTGAHQVANSPWGAAARKWVQEKTHTPASGGPFAGGRWLPESLSW